VNFSLSRQLFLRLLGLVYLIAFASLGLQMTGLVGTDGILPVGELLTRVYADLGARAYWEFPTLLWLSSGDAMLMLLCWGGAALSVVLVAGIAPLPVLVVLWVFYLSLTVAGQVFLEFQWDTLLLETGVLACLYAPLRAPRRGSGLAGAPPSPVVRWVLWSLAFKLTFLSGVTKILSGDPSWAAWTAMTFHYQTQPIPAWTGWYAHHLPASIHYWSVPAMLAVEIAAPFALLLPARFWRTRLAACAAMMLLQVAIGATGNYGFFNLLTIVLYLAALDDGTLRWLSRVGPAEAGRYIRRVLGAVRGVRLQPDQTAESPQAQRSDPLAWRLTTTVAALALVAVSLAACVREMELTARGTTRLRGTWVGGVLQWMGPLRAVNGYGLFRVMTTSRPEIVLEVSADGRTWREYPFRWKAGDPARRPGFVEPHMPRLDWQMWFAALDPGSAQYWLDPLVRRVLAGEPSVVRLLGPDPLAEQAQLARLAYYDYRFTTPAERAATGAWWQRTFITYLTETVRRGAARSPEP
jgi:hypothetical protein